MPLKRRDMVKASREEREESSALFKELDRIRIPVQHEEQVRFQSVRHVGEVHRIGKQALKILAWTAKNHPNIKIRETALGYFGEKNPDIQALNVLIKLENFPHEPIQGYEEFHKQVSILQENKASIGDQLTAVLVMAKVWQHGRYALDGLVRAALEDSNPIVRQRALVELEKAGGETAIETFQEALKDKTPDIRKYATTGLKEFGNSNSVKAIEEALKRETSEELKRILGEALGECRKRKVK